MLKKSRLEPWVFHRRRRRETADTNQGVAMSVNAAAEVWPVWDIYCKESKLAYLMLKVGGKMMQVQYKVLERTLRLAKEAEKRELTWRSSP